MEVLHRANEYFKVKGGMVSNILTNLKFILYDVTTLNAFYLNNMTAKPIIYKKKAVNNS